MLQEHHYCHVQLRDKFLFCIQLIWFSKTLTMSIYDCVFIHECKINFVFLGIRRLTEQDTPPNLNNLITNNNPTHCTCIYKVLTVYFMSFESIYCQICHIPPSTYWVRRRIKGDHGSVSDAPALSLCCKLEPACNYKTLLAYFLPQSAAASHILRQDKPDNQ